MTTIMLWFEFNQNVVVNWEEEIIWKCQIIWQQTDLCEANKTTMWEIEPAEVKKEIRKNQWNACCYWDDASLYQGANS